MNQYSKFDGDPMLAIDRLLELHRPITLELDADELDWRGLSNSDFVPHCVTCQPCFWCIERDIEWQGTCSCTVYPCRVVQTIHNLDLPRRHNTDGTYIGLS